jgi:GNAT superfamily N-acetyltransferase
MNSVTRPFQVRPASLHDIDQLSQLAADLLTAIGADGEPTDARRVFEHMVNSTGRDLVMVAENDGRICGYVYACYKWRAEFCGETMDIVALFVAPEYRSMGVGASLIAATLESARGRGIRRVRAEVHAGNFAVERALESSGFDLERRTLWGREL